MHYPSQTFRSILRSIGLLDNELPRKEIISTDDRRTDRRTDRQTDGQTDGRTDGQTSRTTTIGSFFSKKKKKLLKAFIKWTAIEESSLTYIRGLSKINANILGIIIMGFILLSFGILVQFGIDMIRL